MAETLVNKIIYTIAILSKFILSARFFYIQESTNRSLSLDRQWNTAHPLTVLTIFSTLAEKKRGHLMVIRPNLIGRNFCGTLILN